MRVMSPDEREPRKLGFPFPSHAGSQPSLLPKHAHSTMSEAREKPLADTEFAGPGPRPLPSLWHCDEEFSILHQ